MPSRWLSPPSGHQACRGRPIAFCRRFRVDSEVNLGSECPSLACAVLTSTPSATMAVALVLRRSWKLRLSKLAALTAGSQTRRRQWE